jgi:type I restriction enzyme S subunit
MQLKASGGAQGNLSAADILAYRCGVPVTSSEQQRIASCLSSLDSLITAHTQKLSALKAYKKGLMQQLFPREGETVPRLRFPEFWDAGEWVQTRLGRMGELVSGLTYSPDDVRGSGLLVLRSSNVQNGEIALDDCVYVDPSIKGANLSQPNDILICVRNGSKALIGKCALIPEGMPLCTHGAFMTVFRAKMPSFVFQLFQSDRYQKQVAGDLGATINSINGGQLLRYEFFIPKPLEQQRIADCLSSLDDQIMSTAKKLEALKEHKKGLMQGLFPNVIDP